MTDIPDVKLKAFTVFPTQVQAESPILLTKANGVYTLSLNEDQLRTDIGAPSMGDLIAAGEVAQGYAAESQTHATEAEAARDAAIAAASAANTTGVTNIAALRAIVPTAYAIVTTKGYYTAGDGGGASYASVTGSPIGTYVDNNGSIILPTGGDGSKAWLARESLLEALQWGLHGDGSTDDSSLAQNFVDNNKGKRLVFNGGRTFLIAGLLLVGSTYNNTELDFQGTFKLKARISAGNVNMQSLVFVGIGVQAADNVRIDGNFDGNRAAQYDIEQTFCLCLAGATNFKSDFLSFREISGDGIYVTTELITSASNNSDILTFGTIKGYNSSDAGRNLMSLISGDNVKISSFHSYRVGGVVGGSIMPGGFDAEADNSYQTINNLNIGSIDVVTAGTAGFTLFCTATSGALKGANIGNVSVINTSAASVVDGLGNTTVTNSATGIIRNCEDVLIKSFYGEFRNAYGQGINIGNGTNIRISGIIRHAASGVTLARDAADIYGLAESHIDFAVHDIARYGFQIGNVSTSRISGKVSDPKNAYYAGVYGVITIGSSTNTDMVMEVSCSYNANWTRAYRNDGSFPNTLTECKIMNANFGVNWPSYLSMKDMAVLIYNSPGYTDSGLGIPTTAAHLVGQYIRNRVPVVGQPKGWYCTVSATPGTWVSEGNL